MLSRIKKDQKVALITGGAGFLGSHLCARLLADDWHVICVDNMSTGRERNIKALRTNDKFTFIRHDIIHPLEIGDIRLDAIYNLACPASPPQYQKDPKQTFETSILGIKNMLALAEKHHARLLQASTSEIYGDPLEHPQSESYQGNVNPIGTRSCYDEGKRAAETACSDARARGIDARIIRIFNTYGPNMDANDGRVISNFINQALQNQDITIYGDGSQTRSFCYVSDLITGMIGVMQLEKDKCPNVINLGNDDEHTVKNTAELILKLTGSSARIVYQTLPADDPKKRKPDLSLAKAAFNYKPLVSLNNGLKETIRYFHNLSQEKDSPVRKKVKRRVRYKIVRIKSAYKFGDGISFFSAQVTRYPKPKAESIIKSTTVKPS